MPEFHAEPYLYLAGPTNSCPHCLGRLLLSLLDNFFLTERFAGKETAGRFLLVDVKKQQMQVTPIGELSASRVLTDVVLLDPEQRPPPTNRYFAMRHGRRGAVDSLPQQPPPSIWHTFCSYT